jgi:hypothetical protein
VVTADRRISQEAARRSVKVIDARDFAARLVPPKRTEAPPGEKPDRPLTPEELAEWLKIFGADEKG